MKCFCSGSAGFIGSRLVDALIHRGHEVTVFDNLSTGRREWINPKATFIEGDLLRFHECTQHLFGYEAIFHFAGHADLRAGISNTIVDTQQNTNCTHIMLEAARLYGVKHFVFASSAAVYGESTVFPTPETYAGIQTSLYGASKLAGEALVQAYSEYYDIDSYIFRFVSWIGERYSHGVIFDVVKKLMANPTKLELLGNGRQMKSYLYVKDGVEGILAGFEKSIGKKNLYNLGNHESMSVREVASVICNEMDVDPEITYTGGERGWIGDSPLVHLDITRIEKLGWKPQTSIDEGIRRTVRYLLKHPELMERK